MNGLSTISPSEIVKRREYDQCIRKKLGSSRRVVEENTDDIIDEDVPDDYKWNKVVESITPDTDDIADYDQFMGMEVLLPQNGAYLRAARVIGLNVDSEGRFDANSVLNT